MNPILTTLTEWLSLFNKRLTPSSGTADPLHNTKLNMASNTVHKGWMRLSSEGQLAAVNTAAERTVILKRIISHIPTVRLVWQDKKTSGRCSPGPVDVEAVDVEGEQGDHVREQREGDAEAETRRQAAVPQDAFDERGHQVDVAWGEERGAQLLIYSMMSSVQCAPVCLCDSLIQRWMWYRKKRPSTWSRARFIFRPAGAPISHCSSSSSSLATCWRTNIRH